MPPPDDHIPAPPDLPSYTVEDVVEALPQQEPRRHRDPLEHILFGGGKVIEVATFRRNPAMEAPEEESGDVFDDLLIRSDNVFGEAHEDALRRDFTMNALFYDLDRRQVLDWCGGMDDVE